MKWEGGYPGIESLSGEANKQASIRIKVARNGRLIMTLVGRVDENTLFTFDGREVGGKYV